MTAKEKIDLLTRKHERGLVISNLYSAILACDEDSGDCDICLGLKYAIQRIEKM